ncbi:MAG TPA: hypothetical protein VF556_06480 [Pyrinomonadaceae bacterium]
MSMILRDIHFPVREATISGYILNPDWLGKYGENENPGLCWEVEVHTEEQSVGESFLDNAQMSCGEFSLPIRRWTELEGKTVVSDKNNKDIGAPNALSHFWTHELIPYSTLKFGERAENKFVVHWEGVCHPMLDEPYDTNVPFLIQTEAVFKEISVSASQSDTDATTLERLSKYLDTADLIQRPMKEIVRNDPVENRFGMIDPFVRRLFGFPSTRRSVQRYSIFEPRF